MDHIQEITEDVYELKDIANSLFAVGLTKLGTQIIDIALNIEKNKDAISKESYQLSQERFQQAQQSSINVFKAVLGGIELGRREGTNQ